jgi:hypothetical protein
MTYRVKQVGVVVAVLTLVLGFSSSVQASTLSAQVDSLFNQGEMYLEQGNPRGAIH